MKLALRIKEVMQTLVKFTGIVFLTSYFLLLTSGVVSAQNELSDYQFQYEQYRNLYPQFTRARDAFLQHGTLASQEEAISLTKQLMVQRSQTMRAHLLLLRRRLRDAPDIVSGTRSELSTLLDQEVEWLDTHIKDIEAVSTPTLGGLFELSDRFERREELWRALSYETTSRILIGKTRQVQNEAVTINGLLEEHILRQDPAQQALFKNWLDETKNGAYQSQQYLVQAESMLVKVIRARGNSGSTVSAFTDLQTSLDSSRQLLLRVVGFQKEILDRFEVTNGR